MTIDRNKKHLIFLDISFWILELISFAVSLFLQVHIMYTDTNNQLLKTFSHILWVAGFIFCVVAIIIAIIIQIQQKSPLRTFILIDIFVCTAILACYVKSQLPIIAPNNRTQTAVRTEQNFIEPLLQVRTMSELTQEWETDNGK